MTPAEATVLFERAGAMLSGHFLLSSGRHSDRYVQKARVLEDPVTAMDLAREMASWYGPIEAVVAPAVGAIPVGFAVALAAQARSLFAERETGRMALRRGFAVRPGERPAARGGWGPACSPSTRWAARGWWRPRWPAPWRAPPRRGWTLRR